MEITVSKAAAVKVIQDRIDWWTVQLNKQATELTQMEQRYRDNTCALDSLILYRQDANARISRMSSVLSALYDVRGAMERL